MKPLPGYVLPLSLVIATGALAASLAGLLWEGLYAREHASLAAQAVGQDIVTLSVAVPMLVIASLAAARGSARARLISLGLYAYFLYTYFQYTVLTVYNTLFLLYVLTYSGALVLLITVVVSVPLAGLTGLFRPMPFRRALGLFLICAGTLLGLLWLGLIVPSLVAGTRPALLEDQVSQSLVVQSMDLGLLIPAAVIGGISVLRDKPLGYLLAAIVLTKVVTLGTAIVSMIVIMTLRGVPVSAVQVILFVSLDALGLYFAVRFFLSVHPAGAAEPRPQDAGHQL